MTQRAWIWLVALALAATTLIAVAGQIDIPVVSDLVRKPKVECQDDPSCRAFVRAEVQRALDATHADFVRPHLPQGGGNQTQAPPGQQPPPSSPGGGGNGDGGGGGPVHVHPSPGGPAPPHEPDPLAPVCDLLPPLPVLPVCR